jgi:hypothetical protein
MPAMRARDNPFAVHRVLRLRYRLSEAGWTELLVRLERLRWRAAIVGPEGSGKTTLLEDLAARLAPRGFRVRLATLRRGQRRLGATLAASLLGDLGPGDLVLLDGAQELALPAWLRLRHRARAAGGLVVTSHRPGLLPTLIECATDPSLLADLVGELVKDGQAPAPPRPPPEELHRRHHGNLRLALRELYDVDAGR